MINKELKLKYIKSLKSGGRVPKYQTAWGTINKSDNTKVQKPQIILPIKRTFVPKQTFIQQHPTEVSIFDNNGNVIGVVHKKKCCCIAR